MKKLHILAVMILAVALSACKDDKFNLGNYSENEPARINLRINIPEEKRVSSRSLDADLESRVNQLVMIGFEKTSGRKIFHNLTGNLQSAGTPANGHRQYSLINEVETRSGKYRVYFIANWQSVYSNLTTADIESMNESQIKEMMLTNTGQRISLYGDYGFPMTAYADELTINPDPTPNTLTDISLVRATAHIEFKFINGGQTIDGVEYKADFTPTSYTVYRLPKTAAGWKSDVRGSEVITSGIFDTDAQSIVKEGTADEAAAFDFFMLESKPSPLTDAQRAALTDFKSREAWDGDFNTTMAERNFTNAPANATFVVVTGTYTGPAEKTENGFVNTEYTGQVSFIIHLGNFNTGNGGSYDNFNVNRNEYHTYTVTVNSANSILCNVDIENPAIHNPAMEGYISGLPLTRLDAHYSNVMLTFPQASIPVNTDPQVLLSTVRNDFSNSVRNVKDLTDADDYKWIQFQRPASVTEFPQYAGINADGTSMTNSDGATFVYLPELVDELVAYVRDGTLPTHALVSGTDFVVAAFVDENVYDAPGDPAIRLWAGPSTPDRIMQLSPTNIKVSADEQSTVATSLAFNIQQCPLISTYSLNPANAPDPATYNPFGFERVEEPTTVLTDNTITANKNWTTSGGYYNCAYQWDLANDATPTNTNNGNGRAMMLEMFTAFTEGVDLATAGTYKSFYKLSGDNEAGKYTFAPTEYYTATQAICMRNRDLNGDGKLTADEVRWYIPGIVQYYIYNFGQRIVPVDLRLVDAREDAMTQAQADALSSPSSMTSKADFAFPRYLTSARSSRRIFWQDQRGATSAVGESWGPVLSNIRFARNLGQFDGAVSADYTRMAQLDADNHIIRIINRDIARHFSVTGAYPYNSALSDYNLLPEAFEYSTTRLTLWTSQSNLWSEDGVALTGQRLMDAMNESAVSAYNSAHSTSVTELPDGWRIPNQREMIAMFVTGIIDSEGGNNLFSASELANGTVVCCTFLNSVLWEERKNRPIMISGGNLLVPNASEGLSGGRPNGYVVLVRDVDPATGEPIAVTQTVARLRKMGIIRPTGKK